MKAALTPTSPANSLPKIRVAIIEDQARTREGLRALIGSSDGLECIGAWGSMEDALAADWQAKPNVVLVDLGLPGMSGIEGIAVLRGRCPEAALVVLTVYEDNDRVFRALCAGANGYLLKNTAPAKLVESLREANRGGAPMSPEIARLVFEIFRRVHPPEKATCRERV